MGGGCLKFFSLKGGEKVGILVSLDLLIIEGWIVWRGFWHVCRVRECVGMWKIHCFLIGNDKEIY